MATLNLGKVVGNTGPAGPGVAPGGSSGQVLAKKTDSDYDTEWINPPSGSGGSVAVDATLTKSGQAADAKATGDAIAAEKKARVESVNQLSQQIAKVLPTVTEADVGKFLRVSIAGAWEAETLASAEGASF